MNGGGDIPKQRGIYSEILTTEDTDNLKVLLIFSYHVDSLSRLLVLHKAMLFK